MAPDRWQDISRIYHAVLECNEGDRAAFLDGACAGDDALRREVESLLGYEGAAAEFIETPALQRMTPEFHDADDSGARLAGGQIGSYQLGSLLGAGGMGEVYRARDTKLGRDVAIKILPRGFTADPDRRARFEREARLLAALNHPNIAQIYGLEDVGDIRAVIMELVPGLTLAEMLRPQGRALPLSTVLAIARQVVDALDAAHEKGIIHRDLKPANLIVTPDGVLKVLDFGLAKATVDTTAGPDRSPSPTMTAARTHQGTILGTVGYMSPEQARGMPVDRRADIWAFGCVLYEMLCGCRAFERETIADTLAAILEREPDWHALPEATPVSIRRLLQRCLEKDPKRRLRDIADARTELDDALRPDLLARTAPRTRERVLLGIVVALGLAAAVTSGALFIRPSPGGVHAVRFVVPPPDKAIAADLFPPAISPDGTRVGFVATVDGRTLLWVRSLNSLIAQPLKGTDGAAFPFWSSDSRTIAFFAAGKLKKIDAAGGTPQALCDAAGGFGGTWNRDDVIVFAGGDRSGLYRVGAAGGVATPVTTLDAAQGEYGHRFPHFLPDGRQFVYSVWGPRPGAYVGAIGSPKRTPVSGAGYGATYAAPGYLLYQTGEYGQGRTLLAQPFDTNSLRLTGEAAAVAEDLSMFSVSDNGILVHQSRVIDERQLVWFDRAGRELGRVGSRGELDSPRLSPDGERLAVMRDDDIWLLDLKRGGMTRFTSDPASDRYPVWSSDGSQIVFSSQRSGVFNLYQKPTNGDVPEELFLKSDTMNFASSWSPDGRYFLFADQESKTGDDIWVLPMFGDRKPFPFLKTEFNERVGGFSPDRRGVAYSSDESGQFEVYVRPFPPGGRRWQVSTGGGTSPQWRADGHELFYLAPDGSLMAVDVAFTSVFEFGVPKVLFRKRTGGIEAPRYAAAANGQRFLVNILPDETSASPIIVVLNWTSGLKK